MSEPQSPKPPLLVRVWAHLRRHPWTALTSLVTLVLAGFVIVNPGTPLVGVMLFTLGVNQFCQHHERRRNGTEVPGRVSLGVGVFCMVVGVAVFVTELWF